MKKTVSLKLLSTIIFFNSLEVITLYPFFKSQCPSPQGFLVYQANSCLNVI
ncbi:hypothetical protein PAEVO_19750 [Paenibacillus sp. GM2FR]|nr:hypothetical protein PAEVO_19750 [Paenibacillus sp. GM2FR]